MSTIIQASELQVGDVYATYSTLGRDGAEGVHLRTVTGCRIVKSVETYTVLTTTALDGTRYGEISLRADFTIERLDPIEAGEVRDAMAYLPAGDHLLVAWDGRRFYA